MGHHDRRQREKHELKQTILQVARHIAAHRGWHHVTMRGIASEIEYTPPVIYEFFRDKDALLDEVAREGFRLLLADLQTAHLDEGDDRTRCLTMARTYWNFALKYPELYQVIYGLKDSHRAKTDLEEARAVFSIIREVVHSTVKDRPGRHHHDFMDIVWSLLHGLIVQSMEDQLRGGPERATRLMEQAFNDLWVGWHA